MNLQVMRKAIYEMDKLLDQELENDELRKILEHDRDKMKQAVSFYKWLDRLIDALEDEEIYKLVPKEEQ